MLKFSAKITKLVNGEKEQCFKQIRALSIFSVAGHFHKCQAFADSLEAAGLLSAEMVWASADRGPNSINIVFIGDEDSIFEKIAAIDPQAMRKMPTPPSVLIKMVALRLSKIHDMIVKENDQMAANRAYAAANKHVPVATYPDFPELRFEHIAEEFASYSGSYWAQPLVKDALNVLGRDDVTPEIVRKGWDLYSVKAVMSA